MADANSGAVDSRNGPTMLMWLRQDLRTHDNPALHAAFKAATAKQGRVALVYVWSPEEDTSEVNPAPGGAMRVWYHNALAALDAKLKHTYGAGAGIIYRHGPYNEALLQVAVSLGARSIYANRRYEPTMAQTDARVTRQLKQSGVFVETFEGFLLHEPQQIAIDMTKWVGHFGTLTPFSLAVSKLPPPPKPLPSPPHLPTHPLPPSSAAGGVALEQLGLARMPRCPDGSQIDWSKGIKDAWDFGEDAALELLACFVSSKLRQYETKRQLADARAVSRLSPYLHSGELSVRRMYHTMAQANARQISKTAWRRVLWRDLAYWQLHHWPALIRDPVRTHYSAQRWTDTATRGGRGAAWLKAWQLGRTGFPLVDAGMRELWATGWMQQSVRMVCAAFLTEYLNIHWREGAEWFHDTLVDADLAINAMMWQNAGKSGIDQWNFVMNPLSNAQDPDGNYTRRWVPELAALPTKYVHCPWEAPAKVLADCNVTLGASYPHRIITDLRAARADNSAAIAEAKRAAAGQWADAGGYDLIVVPKGASTTYDGTRMRIFTKREWRIRPNGELAAAETTTSGSGEKSGRAGGGSVAGATTGKGGGRGRGPAGCGKGARRVQGRDGGGRQRPADVKRARRGEKQAMKRLTQTSLDSFLSSSAVDDH